MDITRQVEPSGAQLQAARTMYFGETFAPTVLSSCVHLLSATACILDLDLCKFDVYYAFVQSLPDEDVFSV